MFSLEFQYFLLTKIAQHFIGLLDSNAELQGCLHNAVWQGGTIWKLNDVEIMVEIFECGKAVVVMARSHNYHGLKCIDLVSQIGNIMLNLKHQHCGHVSYKAYVINPDSLRTGCIPLITKVSRVEASSVLYAINNKEDHVSDRDDTKIGRHMFNWLHKFTVKGKFCLNILQSTYLSSLCYRSNIYSRIYGGLSYSGAGLREVERDWEGVGNS